MLILFYVKRPQTQLVQINAKCVIIGQTGKDATAATELDTNKCTYRTRVNNIDERPIAAGGE